MLSPYNLRSQDAMKAAPVLAPVQRPALGVSGSQRVHVSRRWQTLSEISRFYDGLPLHVVYRCLKIAALNRTPAPTRLMEVFATDRHQYLHHLSLTFSWDPSIKKQEEHITVLLDHSTDFQPQKHRSGYVKPRPAVPEPVVDEDCFTSVVKGHRRPRWPQRPKRKTRQDWDTGHVWCFLCVPALYFELKNDVFHVFQ